MAGTFSLFEIAAAYRQEHPRKFDDLDDAELIGAIREVDPDTYSLVDPLLEGAELLAPLRGGPPKPPAKNARSLPTPPPERKAYDPWVTGALRTVPAIGGAVAGSFASPVIGTAAGGAAGAAAGETAAQAYEEALGFRDQLSPGSIAFSGALGALNPAARGATIAGRIGSQAAFGAGLGAAGSAGHGLIEQGALPPAGEILQNAAVGGVTGGLLHGGFEAVGAGLRRAPSFGDSTGALPAGVGPPPSFEDLLPLIRAAQQQYQQEEGRLAQGLISVYGPEAARPSHAGDYHTALEAKSYLEQLAQVGVERQQLEQIGEAAINTLEPPPPLPGARLALPPAIDEAAPPRLEFGQPIPSYPPDAVVEPLTAGGRAIGGAPAGTLPSTPLGRSFQEGLEASLSEPPGPPRLVRPLVLSSPDSGIPRSPEQLRLSARGGGAGRTSEPGVASSSRRGASPPQGTGIPRTAEELASPSVGTRSRTLGSSPSSAARGSGPYGEGGAPAYPPRGTPDTTYGTADESESRTSYSSVPRKQSTPGGPPEPPFLPLRSQEGPLEQLPRVGGRKGSRQQPRLKGVETGQPLDRQYAEGPNAGPRMRGEAHAVPRKVRRQVREGKTLKFETHPTQTPAEDPGTYPPEVRRELGRMLWELQEQPYSREGGGMDAKALQELQRRAGLHSMADAVAYAREHHLGDSVSIPGAPVYHHIREAAEGFKNITREEMTQKLRAAVLEGKGHHLADVAAQIARRRLSGELPTTSPTWAGDSLIGWVDEAGERALPEQDLDEITRAAREMEDGEILTADRLFREADIPEDRIPFFAAYREEGVRRGLLERQQGDLQMGGPGGDKGPRLFDFEGDPGSPPKLEDFGMGPQIRKAAAEATADEAARLRGTPEDVAHSPEAQRLEGERTLPGLEEVRSESRPLPEVADAPFSLTPPPPPKIGDPKRMQLSMWERLKNEEGVLILQPPPPSGDRAGLKKWLKAQEEEHGGAAWYSRVEAALEAGEWDRAWKTAAAASARTYVKAYAAATPQEERQIQAAVRGTALQDDLNTGIISAARQRAGVNEAPPVPDFPPSRRVTQAGAARGKASLGPAGILNPGPRQRPLSTAAPALRAATLDQNVVRLISEGIESPEGLSTVPGNTDTYLRLFRQVGEQIYKGENLKLLREAGVNISPEELAQHWNATISDAGRTLQVLSAFAQANKEALTEAAEAMSMGGAVRGMLGGGPPTYAGKGRAISQPGQQAVQEVIDQLAEDTSHYQAAALANDLQKKKSVSTLRAVHDASYAFMLSKWNTAVRNYTVFMGRYGVEALDHALTIPLAKLTGESDTAALSKALLQERGIQPTRPGAGVTPRRAWSDTLQEIYNFQADAFSQLKPKDVRRSLRLLLDLPEQAAHYLGTVGGEDLSAAFSDTPVIRHLVNPRVQRVLTMFNRAQEFSARATVFDATTRALLRARGLDPTEVLSLATPEIIQRVGGQQAYEDLLFTATSASLEATFAGRTAKDSLPGALIRMINDIWPLKLGVPFPHFNFSAAPRWIYDHSPAALMDWIRFPLDRAGITASPGSAAGGRLYRGVRAREIQQVELPALQLRIGQAERAQGTALQELLGTQREWAIRGRQITRLQKRQQAGLPGVADLLEEAQQAQVELGRRRDRMKLEVTRQRTVVGDLKSAQKKLLDRVIDATAINAPNYAQSLARMSVGGGMLGAAWVVRAQDGAQGTRWYEYKVDRGEGKDPVILDFRPFAPFAQYLYVADVLHDFYHQTDWEKVRSETGAEEEGLVASPLDWTRSIWQHYQGKYTEQELGTQFAQAFFSISRAAGTTLTLTDMLSNMDVPSLEEAGRAIVGTIGQFFSRFTVPGQMAEVIPGFSSAFPEEAKVRTPPKATIEDWERPLAQPLSNVPFAKELIPETISQTTGKPIAAEYPLLRGLLGIGTTPRDFVVEEVRRVGVPGQSVYIKETGDVGLDRTVAESYARILKEFLPEVLEDPDYRSLGTPALQRDYLQRNIFPALKRAALGEAREGIGEEAFTTATVKGEAARRKVRQAKLLEQLEGDLGPSAPEEPEGPPPPPFSPATAPPPPPPF